MPYFFEIGFLAATRDDDFDAGRATPLFIHHIEQAHRRRGDVVFDAVFDFEHIAVQVSDADGLPGLINTNENQPALGGVEKGDDFFLQVELGRQFTLVLDAVGFGLSAHGRGEWGAPLGLADVGAGNCPRALPWAGMRRFVKAEEDAGDLASRNFATGSFGSCSVSWVSRSSESHISR